MAIGTFHETLKPLHQNSYSRLSRGVITSIQNFFRDFYTNSISFSRI
jgi:hypothetical protein